MAFISRACPKSGHAAGGLAGRALLTIYNRRLQWPKFARLRFYAVCLGNTRVLLLKPSA